MENVIATGLFTIAAALIGGTFALIVDIRNTKKLSEELTEKASQASVDTKASQASVDQLASNLEKTSTKEHMDHKFTEVKGSFELMSEKMNANQRITDKSLANVDQFLNNIKAANTDSGSVRDAISTISALASDNGGLNQKIRSLETELYQKNTEINHLKKEILEKNTLVENLNAEIHALKLDNQHKEQNYMKQIEQMQEEIDDLTDEQDNSLENGSRGYEPEL